MLLFHNTLITLWKSLLKTLIATLMITRACMGIVLVVELNCSPPLRMTLGNK